MIQDRVMLLIDADNLSVDVMEQAVRLLLNQHGGLHVRRAYCTAESAVANQAAFKRLGIKPMVNLAAGKNSTDIAMAVDAIDLVLSERPDVVVIASSDSDFAPLVQRLREKGCVVRGIGQKGKVGDETQDVYDDYTVLEHHKGPDSASRPARKTARAGTRTGTRGASASTTGRSGGRAGGRVAPAPSAVMATAAPAPPASARASGSVPVAVPLPVTPPAAVAIEPAAPPPSPPDEGLAAPAPARKVAARKAVKAPAVKKAPAARKAAAKTTAAKTPAAKAPRKSAARKTPAASAPDEAAAPGRAQAPPDAAPAPVSPAPAALRDNAPEGVGQPQAPRSGREPGAARQTREPQGRAAPAGRQTSARAVLDCLPELSAGQSLALNVAVQRLREAQLLGKNSSSLKLFAQMADTFELLPLGKPTQVRLRR